MTVQCTMPGIIFNIQRFCLHDGPGIRTTVFMKGCPLRCKWCCNPEGLIPEPQTYIDKDRIGSKKFYRQKTIGEEYTPDKLIQELLKDAAFFNESGGGVTFSGGEPTMQPQFLLPLLRVCNANNIHTVLDTCGFFGPELIDDLLIDTNLFLFDFKHMNSDKHKEYTGVYNELILSNYAMLMDRGAAVMARMPIIPWYNDDMLNLKATRKFLQDNINNNFQGLSLLPYHPYGVSKYKKFGMEYELNDVKTPSKEAMIQILEFFAAGGINTKIGG